MSLIYKISGKYLNEEWEEIDTAEDKKEAEYLVKEYRMAYGKDWKITYRKQKGEE